MVTGLRCGRPVAFDEGAVTTRHLDVGFLAVPAVHHDRRGAARFKRRRGLGGDGAVGWRDGKGVLVYGHRIEVEDALADILDVDGGRRVSEPDVRDLDRVSRPLPHGHPYIGDAYDCHEDGEEEDDGCRGVNSPLRPMGRVWDCVFPPFVRIF